MKEKLKFIGLFIVWRCLVDEIGYGKNDKKVPISFLSTHSWPMDAIWVITLPNSSFTYEYSDRKTPGKNMGEVGAHCDFS